MQAYGIVWKATDRRTKETVALKKIFDAFQNETDAQVCWWWLKNSSADCSLDQAGRAELYTLLTWLVPAEDLQGSHVLARARGSRQHHQVQPNQSGGPLTSSAAKRRPGLYHGEQPTLPCCRLLNVLKAENDRDLYLTFDFMETDLHAVIRANILEDVHKQYIMYQLFKSLLFLHSAELIHRDIKVQAPSSGCSPCPWSKPCACTSQPTSCSCWQQLHHSRATHGHH